jgi:hypothetical protein
VAASYFPRSLPPLKEETNDVPSPTRSQEYGTKPEPLPDNIVQLNDAAAQLLLMQGMSPTKNPKPDLSRSFSQPTVINDLPFESKR